MAKITLDCAMQDESYFFQFLLNSPRHGVVLQLINGALKRYNAAIRSAVEQHNTGAQQDIALITRFLKEEVHSRVSMVNENFVVLGFERLFGEQALTELLERQLAVVAGLEQQAKSPKRVEFTLASALISAGVSLPPTWGTENGRANLNQLARVRTLKHKIFDLTREIHKLYSDGKRKDSWRLKMRVDEENTMLTELNIINDESQVRRIIAEVHGGDVVRRVVDWVQKNTRMDEYEALRNQIKASRFKGRIYTRSSSASVHKAG